MDMYAQPPYQDADSNPRYIYSGSASPRPGSTHPTTEQRGEHDAGLSAPNVVICGETGAGKSSIINLIAGENLAHISNDAGGCAFQHQRYNVSLNGISCALWDTTVPDEVSGGMVPARPAESNLRAWMRELAYSEGIHLIIYCIPATGHAKVLKRRYDTVFRKKVPVALVVTGLEHKQGEMEMWWNENEAVLRRYGMRFDAHACVTTLDVEDQVIQQRRSDSQRLLRELVVQYSGLPARKIDPPFVSSILLRFRAAFSWTKDALRTKKSTAVPGASANPLPHTPPPQPPLPPPP